MNFVTNAWYRRLIYRRGTARRATSVEVFSTVAQMRFKRPAFIRCMTLKVTQGQQNCHYSIGHISFPAVCNNNVSMLCCFRDIIIYFPKIKEVTWSWTHPFWIVYHEISMEGLVISEQTKFHLLWCTGRGMGPYKLWILRSVECNCPCARNSCAILTKFSGLQAIPWCFYALQFAALV